MINDINITTEKNSVQMSIQSEAEYEDDVNNISFNRYNLRTTSNKKVQFSMTQSKKHRLSAWIKEFTTIHPKPHAHVITANVFLRDEVNRLSKSFDHHTHKKH